VSRLWYVLALAVAACERPNDVAVRVSIPGPDSVSAPVPGVGLIALPYDRDSVLRALAAAAHTPRPSTSELDPLFQQFRIPFAGYAKAAYEAEQLRRSLDALKSKLDSLPRNAPEYRSLYARFGQQSEALSAAEKREKSAHAALDAARATFVSRSDSLRARVRRWEDSTYQGYDSIVERLSRDRDQQTDTTDATGWAHFTLPSGRWWIYARAWDTGDPNAEWYWNLPLESDTVLLSSRTGHRRPKY
jgi:hypothetical protein